MSGAKITLQALLGETSQPVMSPKMALYQALIMWLVFTHERRGPIAVTLDDGEGNRWTWRPTPTELLVGLATGLEHVLRSQR